METWELTEGLMRAATAEVAQTDLASSEQTRRIVVDMDTRKVSMMDNKFGNRKDHLAKTKIIEVTRYVEGVDLAEKHCAIHWENGANGGVYPITNIDLSEEGKILMQWVITDKFTQHVGDIVFALHFFTVVDGAFTYHSSSDPARGVIGRTQESSEHSTNNITASEIEVYIGRMNQLAAQVEGYAETIKEAEDIVNNFNGNNFIQANYYQNDETQPNYIVGRPFYELENGEIKQMDMKFIPDELYDEIDERIDEYINEALGGEY